MPGETNGAPGGGASKQEPTSATKNDAPKSDVKGKGKGKVEAPETTGERKLTGAELKAKAKAEKAARRAQAKASRETAKGEAAVSSSPAQLGPSAGEVKAGKKGKQEGTASTGSTGRPVPTRAPPSVVVVEQKIQIPECFSHLSMAKRLPITQAEKDVHPSVLALGQQMATFTIDESIARLKATLLAFKRVIESYTTPPGATLSRHFTPHVLNPQIEYLTACRPMCFSMGNAIRWLKLQVSKIDIDSSEDVAKQALCKAIDEFIQERITYAHELIVESGRKHIHDGDIILTYGRSTLVEKVVLSAYTLGKRFSVIVIDDPYAKPGQRLAKTLSAEGIPVSYCGDFGGLRNFMHRATKVLLGAEAVFSNGALYARAGSCDIALAAKEFGKKVITLCETINITERVSTDSLTYNEIDPEMSSAAAFRLLFDTTADKYLWLLVTDMGTVQPTSAPDLLRKLEEFN